MYMYKRGYAIRSINVFKSSLEFTAHNHLLMIFVGICTTNDLDALLYHMNNARYLRELDFARIDFYERTDLYREVCSQGSGVVQGAATIRYRRFIKPLTIFKITSKVRLHVNTSSSNSEVKSEKKYLLNRAQKEKRKLWSRQENSCLLQR